MEFFAVFVVIVILGLLGIFFYGNVKDAAGSWSGEVKDKNQQDKKTENDTYIDLGLAKDHRITVTFENTDTGNMFRVFASEDGTVVGRNELGGEDKCISRTHLTLMSRHGKVIGLVNKAECPVYIQDMESGMGKPITECFALYDEMLIEIGDSFFIIHLEEQKRPGGKNHEKTKIYRRKAV